MERDEIREFGYITTISNVPSILKHGLLSHKHAEAYPHKTIADLEIIERRSRKRLPNGLMLDECVNLYFNPRNPMMYRIINGTISHNDLCVLRISPDVLDLEDVMISDMNAASDLARFGSPEEMLPRLAPEDVFADSWNDSDPIRKDYRKKLVCAEAIFAYSINSCYILGACVSGPDAMANFRALEPDLPVEIRPRFFSLARAE